MNNWFSLKFNFKKLIISKVQPDDRNFDVIKDLASFEFKLQWTDPQGRKQYVEWEQNENPLKYLDKNMNPTNLVWPLGPGNM